VRSDGACAGLAPAQDCVVVTSIQSDRAPESWIAHRAEDFTVAAPPGLQRFGPAVQASLCGAPGAPAIVMLGGISADRHPCVRADGTPGWWSGLAGRGCAIDPDRHRILGIDFLADASGQLAPSTRDQAEIVCAVLDGAGIEQAHAIVGSSYGGMVALSLGQHFPGRAKRLAVISACAEPHAAATAVRELQRRIVALGIDAGTPDEALSIARGLAMLTYRTTEEFAARFAGGMADESVRGGSEPGAYLRARGEAWCRTMTPERFLSLSASIDRHLVDPSGIALPVLLVGAESDQLVLAAQMRTLADRLAGPSALHLLPSLYGHDLFLKDCDRLGALVGRFLDEAR